MINKEINFEDICPKSPYYNNIDEKEWLKNKRMIITALKTAKEIPVKKDWFTDVSTYDNELIWQTIYSKHVGEQIGKRDWSRAKYFDDLLKAYKNSLNLIGKIKTIEKLSRLFGKKTDIIKRDVQSAIWIINTIDMYNKSHPDSLVDLRAMEISGYELVLSQKLFVNGQEKTLRKILDLKIDDEKLEINWTDSISYQQLNKIISFLIENALVKKITTRGIDEEIYDDMEEAIGYALSKKRSLNFVYKTLLEKQKKHTIKENIEEKQLEALINLKAEDINSINEFSYKKYDSKFIKSIKYTIKNDLKTLSNLKNFDEDEYPFTNVALTIRNIIDLFILEFFYRIKKNLVLFKKKFDVDLNSMNELKSFIQNYENSKTHDVNKITHILKNIVCAHSATVVSSFIVFLLKEKYTNRLKELHIDINQCERLILNILNFKKDDINNMNNFALLNNLVHKPYYGYENFKNINLIDNLNIMFNTIKEFLELSKIWEKGNLKKIKINEDKINKKSNLTM
ncbi:hypothetical protein [Spiroplasma platyhelix]|uniref:Uncharacterized protein n=1 Tax=Spiroplasma platyhelix PALS-1 TaxID=1276218 RepID=A0A846TPW4_9MOLU|nr:hypothetical protein [Spiroplasma platyhelix]NKE38330.1 hypothetical protein [Spiroplasma platyhelix PALS-1]